jgi:ATP-binding cassette subfamily B protein
MTKPTKPRTEPDGTTAMIVRLLTDYGVVRWRYYAVAYLLMAVAGGCTAASAWFAGSLINEAYLHQDISGVVHVALLSALVFTVRGVASYGHAVMLSRIANSIVAENQRRLFAKLLQQNLSYFAEHHSSEFIARLTTGAGAASQVLNLLINSVGRDLLTLIALLVVMVVQDPVMSVLALVVGPPMVLLMRKLVQRIRAVAFNRWTGGTRVVETMQESLQGIRIVKAFTLEDTMRARFDANVAMSNWRTKWPASGSVRHRLWKGSAASPYALG